MRSNNTHYKPGFAEPIPHFSTLTADGYQYSGTTSRNPGFRVAVFGHLPMCQVLESNQQANHSRHEIRIAEAILI